MAVKVPLKISDASIRSLEELREHFELGAVLGYYSSGRLVEWLRARLYVEEAEQVMALDAGEDDFSRKLCKILGVHYQENAGNDLSYYIKRNERLARLKKVTIDDAILAAVDMVAF